MISCSRESWICSDWTKIKNANNSLGIFQQFKGFHELKDTAVATVKVPYVSTSESLEIKDKGNSQAAQPHTHGQTAVSDSKSHYLGHLLRATLLRRGRGTGQLLGTTLTAREDHPCLKFTSCVSVPVLELHKLKDVPAGCALPQSIFCVPGQIINY